MGKSQKKTGKGRLDKYYHLAKEQGYRSRAAFKLVQLNKKYNFLSKSKVLLDLCAAPGGWSQVAAKFMPVQSLIVAVDIVPIKPIANVISFAEDIGSDKCRTTLRGHLKTWKVDTVLHDGAPNVGVAWLQDAYSQSVLVLLSLKLATEFLREGGTFVTKVFRSKDYNKLIWVFNQLFAKVEATKPPASRNVSAEIFVVCTGFKAPRKLDPKFLDPRSVFEELPDPTPNIEAKVFHPEKRKRQREGYEEGNYLLYKEESVHSFIKNDDPLQTLGTISRLTWSDEESKKIKKLSSTTKEILACCDDLKVLGKKEFRQLLRWRLSVREDLGFVSAKEMKSEEVIEIEPMNEDDQIQADLTRLTAEETAREKRKRRTNNERKQKEIVRMQMGMLTPNEIGMEQNIGPKGNEQMFALQKVEESGALKKVLKGEVVDIDDETDNEADEKLLDGSDAEFEELEGQLDNMYEQYQQRKAEANTKFRAKRARQETEDWTGFGTESGSEGDEEQDVLVTRESSVSSIEEGDSEDPVDYLLTSLGPGLDARGEGRLSRRATLFFEQDEFKDLQDNELETEDVKKLIEADQMISRTSVYSSSPTPAAEENEGHDGFEIVPIEKKGWKNGLIDDKESDRPDIELVSAEAMTLAHQLATHEKTTANLIDEGYNRWSFRDKDGLPSWFLDDERQHSKPQIPITAEAAAAIKTKLKALNARPIKKIQEAKARKKMKAVKRLNKLQTKADVINDTSDISEREKAQSITKLLSKAKRKDKKDVKIVVAHGKNKGVSGRPKGIKGKYKMVDPRMKKEKRALKRIAKKRR